MTSVPDEARDDATGPGRLLTLSVLMLSALTIMANATI